MYSLNHQGFNRCDLFIIVWVLYYLQGIAYPEGGMISIGLLAINLLVSMVCAVKVMRMPGKPVYFKGLNILVGLFTIYGLAYIAFNPVSIYYQQPGISVKSYNYLKSIYLSLLPIYPFYYYTKKGYLSEERLKLFGGVFLLSIVLSYFNEQQKALEKLIEIGSHAEETTNNAGYLFLSFIPLLTLYRKKPLLQFAALSLVMVFIVMGMKRGAIAIGAVTFVYFLFQAIKNSKREKKVILIFLSFVLCLLVVYFFIYQMKSDDYIMQRIEETLEGNSSGRDSLYSFFWNYFVHDASFIHFLLGRGANGTLEIYYNYAHNDWLEIAVNQGLLGVIIYFVYWKNMYATWKNATNVDAKAIIAMAIIVYFAKTLFSMSYGDMTYVFTSVLGYALANVNASNNLLLYE